MELYGQLKDLVASLEDDFTKFYEKGNISLQEHVVNSQLHPKLIIAVRGLQFVQHVVYNHHS